MTDLDQIEKNADQTRNSLRDDVARLNERVSPSAAVSRRSERLRSGVTSVKNRLMGSSDSAGQAAGDKLGSAAGSIKDATGSAAGKLGDAAGSAPDTLRQQATGNPIAAGLIAFGTGWLLSALVPATPLEKQAATKVEDNADSIIDPLKESAQEVAGNLQQPLQESAEALKQSAADATDRTTEQAKSAAADVQNDAQAQQNH